MGERLTVKEPSGNYFFNKKENHVAVKALEDVINKLGKYEDLDEELGVSVLVLARALKEGITVKYRYEWNKYDVPPECIDIDFEKKEIVVFDFLEKQEGEWIYPFNSYGEWWY